MDARWQSYSAEVPDLTNSTRDSLLLKCKSALESLTADFESERRARQIAERKILTMRSDLTALEEQLDLCKRRDQSFTQEAETEAKEKTQLRLRLSSTEDDLAAMREERDEVREKFRTVLSELHTAQKLLAESQAHANSKEEEIKEWEEVLLAMQDKLKAMSADNETLRKDREKYVDNCEKLLTQNERLEELLRTAKGEQQALTEKLEKLREQHLERLAAAEREKALQHQSLTENFSQQTLKFHESVQQELRDSRKEIQRLELEVKRLSTDNETLQRQVALLNSQLHAAKSMLSETEQQRTAAEEHIRALKADAESVRIEYVREMELKGKSHTAAVSRVDEELRAHEKTRKQVEELAVRASRGEQLAEDLQRKVTALSVDLQKKTQDFAELKEAFDRAERQATDNLTRFQQETAQCHSEEVQSLEAKVRLLESHRDYDREQYQKEVQRLKDQYTENLFNATEEAKELRNERNMSRGAIGDLESRISTLTSRLQSKSESLPLRIPSRKRPEDELKEGEGMRFLEQLRELTAKLERTMPSTSP